MSCLQQWEESHEATGSLLSQTHSLKLFEQPAVTYFIGLQTSSKHFLNTIALEGVNSVTMQDILLYYI